MFKKLLKIVLWSCAALLVLLAALIGWASLYEEEITEQAKIALGEQLSTELKISALEYSLFADFPNVSLSGRQVVLFDTQEQRDTLLAAEMLGISFSLFDLIGGDYTAKRIIAEGGHINILRLEDGDNYHFWKTTESADETTKVSFDIRSLALTRMNLRYEDRSSDVRVNLQQVNTELSGVVTEGSISFECDLEADRSIVEVQNTAYLNRPQLDLQTDAVIDLEKGHYLLENIALATGDLSLKGKCDVKTDENSTLLDLHVAAPGAPLAQLFDMLPEAYRTSVSAFAFGGEADVVFSLSGEVGNKMTPIWNIEAQLDDASVSRGEDIPPLNNMDGTVYLRGENGGYSIKTSGISASLDGGEMRLEGILDHHDTPRVNAQLHADVDLMAVQRFFKLDSLVQLTGNTVTDISFAGELPDWNLTPEVLRLAEVSGNMTVSEGTVIFSGQSKKVENINGNFSLSSGYASIQNLALTMGGSDLQLSGMFHQFLAWLLVPGEMMLVEATASSTAFDLASVLSDQSSDDSYELQFPDDIRLKLNVQVDKFTFRQFEATNVKGIAEIDRAGFLFKPISLRTAEGDFQMEMLGEALPDGGIALIAKSSFFGLNLRTLFYAFENFGQTFLVSENVKGKCSAQVVFKARLKNDLSILPASIVSTIDLTVENGELIGLNSMKSISDYMRSNKLIAPFVNADALEDKLEHIRFATLRNKIEISDSQIRFPMMDIHSSAMDIAITGTHWFDQRIDYAIGLYLRDILVQKKQDDFGEVADDGLGNRFFLSMKGTIDNPEFGYDRQAKKEYRKQEMAKEKEEIRQLLRDEFKLGAKRDSVATPPKEEKKVTVTFDDKPKKEEKPLFEEDDEDF